MSDLTVRPWTVKKATPWVAGVHRHLPKIQGGLWAVRAERDGVVVGCAVVGHAARMYAARDILCVLRVAVLDGQPNVCSMLYGAVSRAAKGMGAAGLVTYTLDREPGTSLRAAGWILDPEKVRGRSWTTPSRLRRPPVEGGDKLRWWAQWSAERPHE